MKTLIVALNSKYIHSALAPWYLKASCGPEYGTVSILERTINENADDILNAIYSHNPDITAFSCYIWNIRMVLELASNLRKLLPHTVIVLGGPEVSYDMGELLENNDKIDYILAGEGEKSFPRLLTCLADPADTADPAAGLGSIDGLCYRSASGIVSCPPATVMDLDSIPSPYTDEMLASLKNKIAYFEASRGCPFSCSYCLSSVTEGVRNFSLERVFYDLERLVNSGVYQVKFVDRTFNANRERAKLILKHIIRRYGSSACNFHFEAGADLFDEETLLILENAPKGLFQIEAGVQSTNEKALAAVCRKTDTERLLANIRRLAASGNVHIHADLIAGLPYEDYGSFARSFDSVYSAGPHQLQLGFLKFLKGTRLRREADDTTGSSPCMAGTVGYGASSCESITGSYSASSHEACAGGYGAPTREACTEGYIYREMPPYEILSGKHIGYDELSKLKGIAELVDKYHNSGRFDLSLNYLTDLGFGSPFGLYECFLKFNMENGLLSNPAALREYYAIQDRFASGILDENGRGMFRELLRFDFLAADNTGTLPAFFESRGSSAFRDRCFEFLRENGKIRSMIPEAADMTPKQLMKKVHFECFRLGTADPAAGNVFTNSGIKAPVAADLYKTYKYDAEAEAVFIFNYISRDKVTGRYPFYAVNIQLSQKP
ncbi:MAG TPA: B12-binding domain-containing radical SAM protein [Clostridia bacterium]|nr:B12-binding domain-containing radical SAM protein [Clostridia bacterium]